jgi:F-type H+-transporting ATPase subunit b
MESLIALQGILLRSIPTFVLVWILYLFVSKVFYKPLQETLRKRHDATEGLRKKAEERIAMAERKAAEYQQALQAGRAVMYREQEEARQKAMERRAEIVRKARESAEQKLRQGRQQVEAEALEGRQFLARESEQMAAWITRALLESPPRTERGVLSRSTEGPQ